MLCKSSQLLRCVSRTLPIVSLLNKCSFQLCSRSADVLVTGQSSPPLRHIPCAYLALPNLNRSISSEKKFEGCVFYPNKLNLISLEYSPCMPSITCKLLRSRFSITAKEARKIVDKHPLLSSVGKGMLRFHIEFMLFHGVSLEDMLQDIDVLYQRVEHFTFLCDMLREVDNKHPHLGMRFAQMYPLCRLSRAAIDRWKCALISNGSRNAFTRLSQLLGCSLLTSSRIISRISYYTYGLPVEKLEERVLALMALGLDCSHLLSEPRLLKVSTKILLHYQQQLQRASSKSSHKEGATVDSSLQSCFIEGRSKDLIVATLLARAGRYRCLDDHCSKDTKRFAAVLHHIHSNKTHQQAELPPEGGSLPPSLDEIDVNLTLDMYSTDVFQFIADRFGVSRKAVEHRFSLNDDALSLTLHRFESVTALLRSAGYSKVELLSALPTIYRYCTERLQRYIDLASGYGVRPPLYILGFSERRFKRHMERKYLKRQKNEETNKSSDESQVESSG